MEKRNDGAWLQDALQAQLKHYCEHHPAFWHRFPDTKSAQGAYLKAQPGDFFWMMPRQCLLIECKSTIKGTSLLSLAHHGTVGKRQIAKHRLWNRAGHLSFYLYGDRTTNRYEWHLGKNVASKCHAPVVTGLMPDLAASLSQLAAWVEQQQ